MAKTLEELRKRRERIEAEIRRLEDKAREQRRQKELERNYLKAVCFRCGGTGMVLKGHDALDAVTETCGSCDGEGWVWVRKWDGVRRMHDTSLDSRSEW